MRSWRRSAPRCRSLCAVVELTVPLDEIERRLSSAVSTGRAKDLEEARQQSGWGDLGLSDVVIANDRPIWEIADEVLDWLQWR